MQTYALTSFLTDAQMRACLAGVADTPVDALRNKGGRRSDRKRDLLAKAAARTRNAPAVVISYF